MASRDSQLVNQLYKSINDQILTDIRQNYEQLRDKSLFRKKFGKTVLQYAASKGVVSIVRLLVHLGADIYETTRLGLLPVQIAGAEGHTSTEECLSELNTTFIANVEKKGKNPLLNAIKRGCISAVRYILQSEDGHYLLMKKESEFLLMALEQNDIELFTLLKEYMIKPDLNLLLIVAVTKHIRLDAIKYLIDQELAINDLRSVVGQTLLHAAMNISYTELLMYLVSKDDWSGLKQIIEADNLDLIEHLMKEDITISQRSNVGLLDYYLNAMSERNRPVDPFNLLKLNDLEVLKKCFQNNFHNLNALNAEDETLLATAVGCGYEEIVDYLVGIGANVSKAGKKGETPLLKACINSNIEMCRLLLENGAPLFTCQQAFFRAIEDKNYELVQLFINNEVDVNASDKNGKTALATAILGKDLRIVKLLLENGADTNIPDGNGNTSLELSVNGDFEAATRLLITNGSNLNKSFHNGNSIIGFYSKNGDVEMVKYLMSHGECTDQEKEDALNVAVKNCHQEVCKFLLDSGVNTNGIEADSILECFNKKMDAFIKELIDHDVNVDVVEDDTLLHRYLDDGNIEMAKYLIANGADTNAPDKNNVCPLVKAARLGNSKLIDLLLAKGADPFSTNCKDRGLLAVAATEQCFCLVVHLIDNGADLNDARKELEDLAEINEEFACYLKKANMKTRFNNLLQN